MLDAEASAWVVQANAYTQMGMAELLRVNSANLSNRGGTLKDSTTQMQNLNQRMLQISAALMGGRADADRNLRISNDAHFRGQRNQRGALGTEQSVSYVLMTICLVLGIYEAYTKGGDLRSLAGTLLKYAVAAFLIGNWTAFFSDAYSGFNQLASAIDSAYGAVDLAKNWQLQLSTLFANKGYQAVFNAIPWTPSALLTLVEIVLAYIIYPIAVQIFALIYTFWGTCLFAMGPFVIALAPSSLVNSLTKYYALNLGIWNAWSIIYAVFGCLITAIHANDVNAILNGDLGSFGLGPTMGATGPLDGGIETIGLISIMYAICILLIPMVAAFILRGQFSAVGLGLSMVGSRVTHGISHGAELGAAAGPAGAVAGGIVGAGMGLMGGGMPSTFSTGGAYGALSVSQGGGGSMPPPNTPDDPNMTRFA